MKPMAKLSNEEMERLALMFEIAPRLADAYRLKNEFLDVIRAKSSAAGKPKLIDWLRSAETMGLPEFSDCIKAYRNWFREILNSMDTLVKRLHRRLQQQNESPETCMLRHA